MEQEQPVKISIWDLTCPIYYNCKPTSFSEWMVNNHKKHDFSPICARIFLAGAVFCSAKWPAPAVIVGRACIIWRCIYTTFILSTALQNFGTRANSFGHGPLDLYDKICSRFFNVDSWNGTPVARMALLNFWAMHLYDSGSHVISSTLPACPARFHGLFKKKGKYVRFSSGKSNCMPLCFEKAKTSVTIEGQNKVIPCTVLTYIKAVTIRPAACCSGRLLRKLRDKVISYYNTVEQLYQNSLKSI